MTNYAVVLPHQLSQDIMRYHEVHVVPHIEGEIRYHRWSQTLRHLATAGAEAIVRARPEEIPDHLLQLAQGPYSKRAWSFRGDERASNAITLLMHLYQLPKSTAVRVALAYGLRVVDAEEHHVSRDAIETERVNRFMSQHGI